MGVRQISPLFFSAYFATIRMPSNMILKKSQNHSALPHLFG